jgi:hypothetical protein
LTQQIINQIFNATTDQLQRPPQIVLSNSCVIDTGGVLADCISRTLRYLLDDSNIFQHPQTENGYYTFNSNQSMTQFMNRSNLYFAFGRIIYWFVIIHSIISFPAALDPHITAYILYEQFPSSLIIQSNMALGRIIDIIENYDENVTMEQIQEDGVDGWLIETGFNEHQFLCDLRDSQKGAGYLAKHIGNNVMMKGCDIAFEKVYKGFLNGCNFQSVYFLIYILNILIVVFKSG